MKMNQRTFRIPIVLAFALTMLFLQGRASAYTFTYAGKGQNSESGNTLAAQVKFDYDGGSKLFVTLTNISPSAALTTSDVLTAVYFSMAEGDDAKPIFAQLVVC